MTNEEYQDFVLRYKGCGACFPMYHTLSRREKMWFTAIQKDVTELEKEKCELLGIIQGKDKVISELEAQIEQLQKINNRQKETLKKLRIALIQERTANIINYGKGGVEMFDSMFEILKDVSD